MTWVPLAPTQSNDSITYDESQAPPDLALGIPNRGSSEWIQHEQVGHDAGLTTAQLYVLGMRMRGLRSCEVEARNEGQHGVEEWMEDLHVGPSVVVGL